MEAIKRTVVGNFSNLDDARAAVAELRNAGYTEVRLVENDNDPRYASTSQFTSNQDRVTNEGGISGFFSRLFGFDEERSTRTLNSETENYFTGAYKNKHHLVIVTSAERPERCIDIIRSLDGKVEEESARLYERDYFADTDLRTDANRDRTSDSEQVLELREEQLEVGKDRVQSGSVNVRKELITEMKTVEVPLTREEIVVERKRIDGVPREGSLSANAFGESEEIRIPVSEEHVHIEKKVVPIEEVRVSKQSTTETQTVSEEVRREEARIESEGRVSMKNRDEVSKRKTSTLRDSDLNQPNI